MINMAMAKRAQAAVERITGKPLAEVGRNPLRLPPDRMSLAREIARDLTGSPLFLYEIAQGLTEADLRREAGLPDSAGRGRRGKGRGLARPQS